MLKKTVFVIINTFSVLMIAAAVAVLCVVLLTKPGQPPNIFGYQALRVTTGSMAPTYPVDTLLLVKNTPPEDIKVGDVISFYSTDPALEGAVQYPSCDSHPAGKRGIHLYHQGGCQQCGRSL